MCVLSLDGGGALEEKMATHSSILAWKVPQTEDPGGLQSMGLQRVRHDLVTEQQQQEYYQLLTHEGFSICSFPCQFLLDHSCNERP